MRLFMIALSLFLGGCTLHHSRAIVPGDAAPPSPSARFVSEDDSGLLLFGLLSLSEPDHYSVLLERARRKHNCARLSHGELDYYTDHWLLVGFPVARLTLLCEPAGSATVTSPTVTPSPTVAPPSPTVAPPPSPTVAPLTPLLSAHPVE